MITKKDLERITPVDNRPPMQLSTDPAGDIQVYFVGRDYTGRRGDLFSGFMWFRMTFDPAVAAIIDNDTGEILYEKGVYYV